MKYTLDHLYGIEGQVIVVTGGSDGIGRGLAGALADLGACVGILSLVPEACDKAAQEICDRGGRAVSAPANVANEQEVSAAFRKVYEHFGRIDGLVNVAGINHIGQLAQQDMDDWKQVLDVNLLGTVLCTREAGRYMLEAGHGRVVNISSWASVCGKPGYSAYTASKGAVNAFTQCMAIEWSRRDINVNAIAPVMVITDINRKQIADNPGYLERVIAGIPQGRTCQVEYLVGPVVYLLSASSTFMTGQTLFVDGGCTAGDVHLIKPE